MSRPDNYPDTPNLDKMVEIQEKSQICGEFLEWIMGKYEIAAWHGERLHPTHVRIEPLLAEFFDIDYEAMEKERDAVLKYVQEGANA